VLGTPTLIKVYVCVQVFQLVLPAEVTPDNSKAQRSQTTGHLLLTLPLVQLTTLLKHLMSLNIISIPDFIYIGGLFPQ